MCQDLNADENMDLIQIYVKENWTSLENKVDNAYGKDFKLSFQLIRRLKDIQKGMLSFHLIRYYV